MVARCGGMPHHDDGCRVSVHYKITEPTSKIVYYTRDYEKTKAGGASFKDARTGAIVTIQNSEIKEVSRQYLRRGRKEVKK